MAGVTWRKFYFRLFPGSIRSAQVVQFLRHLLRHIRGKVLVIWDGLRSHRSRMVSEFVMGTRGRLALEFLPAYAPELNPVEYLWGYWKQHELPNFCPKSFFELSLHAPTPCAVCAAVQPWSPPSGNRRNCSSVTILCKT
jgi:transposase